MDRGRIHLKKHNKLLRAECTMEDIACVFLKKTQLMRSEGDIGKLGVREESTDISGINTELEESCPDYLNWKNWGKIGPRKFAFFHSSILGFTDDHLTDETVAFLPLSLS
jgi:hypothetical protein